MPLLQVLSWHSHFVNAKAPLCFWSNAPDCSTRMALGLTCHDAPRVPPLTIAHERAADGMWRLFDLVGVTDMFDEFVLLLADLVGLPHAAYRAQLVDRITQTASLKRVRRWSTVRCAKLAAEPPPRLLLLVERKLNASREQADRQRRRMECWTYGCTIGHRYVSHSNAVPYDAEACASIRATHVLRRICRRVAIDERVYLSARQRFKQLLAVRLRPAQLAHRLSRLRTANAELAARAARQQRERLPGHSAASASCVRCAADVVPEFDLGGCWPLWNQFAPDERRFRCTREWTTDPAYRDPSVRPGYREKPIVLRTPMACWTTCWEPTGAVAADVAHCTAPCPADAPLPLAWRSVWNGELARFNERAGSAGHELALLRAPFKRSAVGSWHAHYDQRQIFRVF